MRALNKIQWLNQENAQIWDLWRSYEPVTTVRKDILKLEYRAKAASIIEYFEVCRIKISTDVCAREIER